MLPTHVQYGHGTIAQSQMHFVKWSQWKKCWNKLLEIMSSQGEFNGNRLTKRVKIDDSTIGCKPVAIFPMENVDFSEQKQESGNFEEIQQSVPIPFISPGNDTNDTFPLDSQESLSDYNDTEVSSISNLSLMSGQDWKPFQATLSWVQSQMEKGTQPRSLLANLMNEDIPEYMDDTTLWKLLINMVTQPPQRQKLDHINTIENVVELLKVSGNVIVLTGAGVSVSSGIPDFRSKDGIYARLAVDFPDLPDPQSMFDIQYFMQDPRPFFKFAKEIYPGKFEPSPCHRFIKLLEKNRKLLRNYTQNIDTLENLVGIKNLIECHGSFATASCTKCSYQMNSDQIKNDIFEQKIPMCPKCKSERESNSEQSVITDPDIKDLFALGIMKPDIVFFGEGLPETFHQTMSSDKTKCDLLIVIGSSLKVRPVALIPTSLPPHVPQILINREPLSHLNFDVELLGDCDVIINKICQILGDSWLSCVWKNELLHQTDQLLPPSQIQHQITPNTQQNSTKVDINPSPVTSAIVNPSPSSSTQIERLQSSPNEQLNVPVYNGPMSEYLPPNTYYFQPPCRYIFQGAEVAYSPDFADEPNSLNFSSDSESSESDNDNDNDEFDSIAVTTLGNNHTNNVALSSPSDNDETDHLLNPSHPFIIPSYLTQDIIEQYLNQQQNLSEDR